MYPGNPCSKWGLSICEKRLVNSISLFVKLSLAIQKIHIKLSSAKQNVVAMDEVWRGLTCRKLAWILPVEADPPIGEHPPQSRQYASIATTVSRNLKWTAIGSPTFMPRLPQLGPNWASIESQSLSSRWRTPPGFGEGWSHGNHRQGISAQRGGADYLNFTMNLSQGAVLWVTSMCSQRGKRPTAKHTGNQPLPAPHNTLPSLSGKPLFLKGACEGYIIFT